MNVKSRVSEMRRTMTELVSDKIRPELVETAWAIVCFAGGFILSAARVLGTGAPFGIAAVAAAGAGLNGVCALVGAVLGYLITGGLDWGIRYLAASVIVFTVEFAFQETKLYKLELFAPLTAAAVSVGTGVLASFSTKLAEAPAAAVIALEASLALGGCYFFREALCDGECTTEAAEIRHAGSVLITIAVLLMALSGLLLFKTVSIGRLIALLLVMTGSLRCGMLLGCTYGTAFGLAMDLVGGGLPFFTLSYAFSGLLSGVFNRHGRFVFVLSFIAANAVAVICTWSAEPQLAALFEVFCASVIFMVLPSRFLSRIGAFVQPTVRGSGESGLRRYVSKRVLGLSSAYSELYEIVRRNVEDPSNDSDPSKVFDRAADAVCISCKHKNRCWNSDYIDTLSAINDASEAMRKRGTLQIGDFPAHFREKCRTPEAFVTAVNAELRAAAYRRQYRAELAESRDTAWGQYADMADILEDVSRELAGPSGADYLAERRLIRYLRTLDIDADTAVYRDGRGRLRVVIESGNLTPITKDDDCLEKLSAVLGIRLCKPKNANESTGRLVLCEAEPLAVSVGIAAMKKKGEDVSGDRGTYFKTDFGVLCVILSDGMGCGASAARESGEVVEILEKFLRSGIDPAVAMKTLNSVMLLRSGDNRGFATVDLMCVDLFSGDTSFYKYGAAPSYVMNGKNIRRIKGTSFAPGLTSGKGGAPDTVRMRLKPGSTAIIASDGVIGDANDGWLREILDSSTDDMKLLARDTLREAEKIYGKNDDMTVLAVRVEARS